MDTIQTNIEIQNIYGKIRNNISTDKYGIQIGYDIVQIQDGVFFDMSKLQDLMNSKNYSELTGKKRNKINFFAKPRTKIDK